MVVAIIQQLSTASALLESASLLAKQLGKSFALVGDDNEELISLSQQYAVAALYPMNEADDLVGFCESNEVSFLFVQLTVSGTKQVRKQLSVCRGLRIPYCFFKDTFAALDMTKVLVPVGFLEEELEKAQFASAFGRFCGSEISILLANDYGSKAATNAGKMQTLFDKFEFKHVIQKAEKDSFKVDIEAALKAEIDGTGLIIVSASRDYGLDDIIFGPKEQKVIQKSPVPVLLVNPRGDLYALCD